MTAPLKHQDRGYVPGRKFIVQGAYEVDVEALDA